jgi:capsular exopolysaccharide synthesis family protein
MMPPEAEPIGGFVADQERGLRELLDTLRWHWKIIVPIVVGTFLLATAYVASLPSTYTSESVVAFSPRPEAETASADTVRVVVPKYLAYVTAPVTITEVATELGEQPGAISEGLDAEVEIETGNLRISMELTSAQRASRAANAFAEQVIQFAEPDNLLEAQLVAEAATPTDPSGPPRRLLQAAAIAFGLLLGIAVAFIIETQRPRLRSWTDMARMTGYRVIGRVPASRRLKNRPREALAEPVIGSAFRTLRANLDREAQERPLDVLVVTSAEQGEGKTTVSGLLAESIARLGTKVLLIDADLRRPQVSRTYRIEESPGLSSVLRGETALEDAIRPGWCEGLDVLPTSVDPEASDLLVRRFKEITDEARERYEMIVVDTAPLLGVADARSLAAGASGVLLVLVARQRGDVVNEAVLALETIKAPVLGVVGNRLRETARAYAYHRA